jgi:hypothetical protein
LTAVWRGRGAGVNGATRASRRCCCGAGGAAASPPRSEPLRWAVSHACCPLPRKRPTHCVRPVLTAVLLLAQAPLALQPDQDAAGASSAVVWQARLKAVSIRCGVRAPCCPAKHPTCCHAPWLPCSAAGCATAGSHRLSYTCSLSFAAGWRGASVTSTLRASLRGGMQQLRVWERFRFESLV